MDTPSAAALPTDPTPAATFPRGFTGSDQPDPAILQRCIQCGLCLPHCPTYLETQRETSSPRGRIHLIRAVAEGHLDVADPTFAAQMYECLDCRACEAVCPSGVAYGQLVETARAQIERARPRPAWQRAGRALALGGLFGAPGRFRLGGAALRAYQRAGPRRLARATGALRRLGLAETEALLPDLPPAFIAARGQVYAPIGPTHRGRVALLAGCVMSTAFAATDRATIRVLTLNGYEVIIPGGQGCCGAITIHAGEPTRARILARRNIAAFESAGAEYVLANAAGCGATLKEYARLLADDPDWAERAAAFTARVRDASEPLADLLAAGDLNTAFTPLSLRVTYQEPCHLAHAQRISRQPRQLLGAIPGVEVVDMAEPTLCCGSAGVYNLTHPTMANRLGDRKARHIAAAGADVVVTANPGCHLQVRASLARAGTAIPVLQLMDFLDAAYRGVDPRGGPERAP